MTINLTLAGKNLRGEGCKISNKIFRIFISVILLAAMSLNLTGCWDSRELSELALGDAVGFDLDTETNEHILTIQYIIPQQVKGGSKGTSGESGNGGGGITPAVQVEQSRSNKFWLEALENYSTRGSRALFNQAFAIHVIGQEVAQQELYRYIEHLLRSPQARPTSYLMLAEGKASDILYAHAGMESIPGIGLAGTIKLSDEFSIYPPVNIVDFAKRMMSETTAPIMPIVGVLQEKTIDGKDVEKLYIKGLAVFKNEKMVGELNPTESKGLLWVINKEKHGFNTTDLPDGEQVTTQVIGAKSEIKPLMEDGKITINLTVKDQASLSEYSGQQNLNGVLIKQIEEAQGQAIKSEITAALNKSMALNADIFGFGEAVHRKYKTAWPDIASRWNELYPNIKVNIQVKTEIKQIGGTKKAIVPKKNK
ncbi:MAG: Ger(x)C family spore germination protein [Syntrophomonas sp.]